MLVFEPVAQSNAKHIVCKMYRTLVSSLSLYLSHLFNSFIWLIVEIPRPFDYSIGL